MTEKTYINLNLKIPKKLFALGFIGLSMMTLIFMSVMSVNAQTSQPQPSGTDFTWTSVASGNDRFNTFEDISYDGRYVTFTSTSPLLVEGDTNNVTDVFVKDMQTGAVERTSVAVNGAQLSGSSNNAVMSPNAQYVAFSNLDGGIRQTYVHDRSSGATMLASSSSSGTRGDGDIYPLSVSNNGKLLEEGWATNLVTGVTSGAHIYLKDVTSGSIEELPFVDPTGNGDNWTVNNNYGFISADGNTAVVQAFDQTTNYRTGGNATIEQVVAIDLVNQTAKLVTPATVGSVSAPAYWFSVVKKGLSSDGRYVLFYASDHHLLNSTTDATLYRTDLQTGAISAVDILPSGRTANGGANPSNVTTLSNDGRFIGFTSNAVNLDASFLPSRVVDGNGSVIGSTLYVRDMNASTSSMKVNQTVQGGSGFAPGSGSFAFSTNENIDSADFDGRDVYVTN